MPGKPAGGGHLRRLPPPRRNGVELQEYLAEALSCSRRAAKALLDDRLVFVNGRRIWMARHLLQTRDTVELLPGAVPKDAPSATPPPPIRILLDDPRFLVADKPPALLTNGPKSLETRLRGQLDLPSLRAAHRLDKDTTGCLVACKNDHAHTAIARQLEDKTCFREYHAIVTGVIANADGLIDAPIGRDPRDRQRMAVTEANSRDAVTHFHVLERFQNATYLTCRLETGRTHQIRVHLAAIGCPVCGDFLYGTELPEEFPRRFALHSAWLKMLHPRTGKPIELSSEPPWPGG
jgi:23S rRNA pseudouridine1911/1915/1917 synthase